VVHRPQLDSAAGWAGLRYSSILRQWWQGIREGSAVVLCPVRQRESRSRAKCMDGVWWVRSRESSRIVTISRFRIFGWLILPICVSCDSRAVQLVEVSVESSTSGISRYSGLGQVSRSYSSRGHCLTSLSEVERGACVSDLEEIKAISARNGADSKTVRPHARQFGSVVTAASG